MSTKAPPNLFKMYGLLDPHLSSLRIGGIVGDTAHVAGGGYHISRDDLKNHGQGSDYSVQCPADQRGSGSYASAIDLSLDPAEMQLVTTRLRTACTGDDYDPRIEPLREFIGCLDGKNVCGYNRVGTGSGSRSRVGWVASGFSTTSHRWHVHLSFLRDYSNGPNSIAGVAEVVAGLAAGALGWQGPNAPEEIAIVKTPPPASIPGEKPVMELDAPGHGNWQGAVLNRETHHWFLAEAQKLPTEDREDVVFHHFDEEGQYLDSMRCEAGTGYSLHPTGFGVDSGDELWFTWNETSNDVVRVKYRAGATLHKGDTEALHVFTDGHAQVVLSPTKAWVAIRELTADTETYTRHSKANVLSGKEDPSGVPVVIERRPDRVVQGFSVVERFLYVLTGLHSPGWIDKYSFDTGKPVARMSVDAFGMLTGDPDGRCEPEGMDGRYFGCKVYTGSARRLRIYRHAL